MGWIRQEDLDPRLFEDRPEDPYGMEPVGRRSKTQPVECMRVGTALGNETELVFVGDVPGDVRTMRREVTAGDGQRAGWLRLEVSLRRARKDEETTDGPWASTGEDVVIAEHPWSQEWVQPARLRRSNKDSVSPEYDWRGLDSQGLILRVESLGYDLFEKNNSVVTAAVSPRCQGSCRLTHLAA